VEGEWYRLRLVVIERRRQHHEVTLALPSWVVTWVTWIEQVVGKSCRKEQKERVRQKASVSVSVDRWIEEGRQAEERMGLKRIVVVLLLRSEVEVGIRLLED
jgi:hypothetical protein